jgi:Protein of unknown function (DUF2490)
MKVFTKPSKSKSAMPDASAVRTLFGAFACFLALGPSPALAEVDNRLESWTMVSVQKAVPPISGLTASLDMQWRWTEDNHVFALRPLVGYLFATGVAVAAGYQFTDTADTDGDNKIEHRLVEQASIRSNLSETVLLSVRTRLEQRFGWGDDVGHRIRLQARVVWGALALAPVRLVLSQEHFQNLNTTDWGPKRGFDQERTFVGATVQTTWRTRFELGYLGTYANRDPDQLNHGISLIAVTEI